MTEFLVRPYISQKEKIKRQQGFLLVNVALIVSLTLLFSLRLAEYALIAYKTAANYQEKTNKILKK